jgi:hypothetical protein
MKKHQTPCSWIGERWLVCLALICLFVVEVQCRRRQESGRRGPTSNKQQHWGMPSSSSSSSSCDSTGVISEKLVVGVLYLGSTTSPAPAKDDDDDWSLKNNLSDLFSAPARSNQENTSSSRRIRQSNPTILFLQQNSTLSPYACIDGLPPVTITTEEDTQPQSTAPAAAAATTQAMAMLCDVLVLYLPDTTTSSLDHPTTGSNTTSILHNKAILQSLRKGLQQRKQTGSVLSKLIVISPSFAGDDDDGSSSTDSNKEADKNNDGDPSSIAKFRKEMFTTTLLADFGTEDLDRLELVTPVEFEAHWDDYVVVDQEQQQYATTMSSLLESDNDQLFLSLLEQVLMSIAESSSPVKALSLHPMKASAPSTPSMSQQSQPSTNSDDIIPVVIQKARNELDLLEQKMQDVWLANEDGKQQPPLLEFGKLANDILNQAHASLSALSNNNNMMLVKDEVLERIASQLKSLYDQQLDALREYYGKRYEKVLQELPNDEQAWTEAAGHMTEGFRTAAQYAIPELCQADGELQDADFEYVVALRGLITDMMEATAQRQDEEEVAAELAIDDDGGDVRKKRLPRWLKKLGARALMLGVNYLQGWLAWQAIKRAAIQRDRDMPKFPLF